MRIIVINGPNLNLLGTREPAIYGTATLADLEGEWRRRAIENSASIEFFQSNHEGALVDAIQRATGRYDALIINAGALTHYSYSLRDAVAVSGLATVEVHISNIYEREEWRRFSVLTDVCELTIVGRGTDGYINAIDHLTSVATWPPLTTAYADHRDAVLDLRVPPGSGQFPVAVLVHGGFWGDIWKRDLMDPMAVALAELGWATANIEYTRGQGSYGSAVGDVEAAVEWLLHHATTHHLDIERIAVVGHSAGGYLALKLAENGSPIAGVVPLAAVSSLSATSSTRPDDDPVARFLGASRIDAPRLWSQAELTGEPNVLVRMLHGGEDQTVQAAQSEAYAENGGPDATVTTIEGVGHMDLIDPTAESWQELVANLEQIRN